MTPHEWNAAGVAALVALIAMFRIGWMWGQRRAVKARPGEMCQDCYAWCAPCGCCEDDLKEFDALIAVPDVLPAVVSVADMTDDQWAAELHEMNEQLSAPLDTSRPAAPDAAVRTGPAGESQLAYTLDPESLWQLRRMTLMGRDRERWAASMGFAVTDSGDLAVAA